MSGTLVDALERAALALRAHPDLPSFSSVSITEDGLWVNPWVRGMPVTALLGWHDVMADTEREYVVTGIEGGDAYTQITVRGLLDDVAVIAQAVTYQPVLGDRGRVSTDQLRQLASKESAY